MIDEMVNNSKSELVSTKFIQSEKNPKANNLY